MEKPLLASMGRTEFSCWEPGVESQNGPWSLAAICPYPLSTTLTIAPLVSVPAEFKTLALQPRKEDLHILNSLC